MSGTQPSQTVGVVLMDYGTPASLDQVEEYYTHIRRGRPPSPEELADLVRVEQCRHNGGAAALEAAVVRAVAYLEIEHGGQGNVLLAPLAASFDQFSDYADRAKVFRAVVDRVITARRSEARSGGSSAASEAASGEEPASEGRRR